MRRCLTVLIAVILALGVVVFGVILLFSYLFAPQDAIIKSLPDYESKEYYTCGGFQDYTDYAKYTYRIAETALIWNSYFLPVTDEDIPEIQAYIENFEGWVDVCTNFPAEKYDFNKATISEGDYYYILSEYQEPDKEFWNYDVYYFDLDAQILYYFHNNI